MTDLLKRFAGYYRPHRGLFARDFSSAVVAGLLELAFPIAVTLYIDRLLPTNQLDMIALASLGVFFRPIDKINSVIATYPTVIADFQRYTNFVDTRPVIADRPDVHEIGCL